MVQPFPKGETTLQAKYYFIYKLSKSYLVFWLVEKFCFRLCFFIEMIHTVTKICVIPFLECAQHRHDNHIWEIKTLACLHIRHICICNENYFRSTWIIKIVLNIWQHLHCCGVHCQTYLSSYSIIPHAVLYLFITNERLYTLHGPMLCSFLLSKHPNIFAW